MIPINLPAHGADANLTVGKMSLPKSKPLPVDRDRTTDVLACIGAGLALLAFLFYVFLGIVYIVGMEMADR